MKRSLAWIWLFLIWLGGFTSPLYAQISIPELNNRVVDTAAILTPDAVVSLNAQLKQLEDEKGAQLVVLTVPTLQGEAIESFLYRVSAAWKIGRAKTDDGVVLLVVPQDRAARIEVGRGLEGAIPDIYAKRIIDDVMIPFFRSDQYPEGIVAGVEAISALVRGEALPLPTKKSSDGGVHPGIFVLLFLGVMLAQVLSSAMPPPIAAITAAGVTGGAGILILSLLSGVIVAALTLIFSLSGGGVGSSFPRRRGGFTIGHGGGGFGGGDIFSGGGGTFSGGGASGRW